LPVTGSDVFGREEDIAFLDRAWAKPDVNVVLANRSVLQANQTELAAVRFLRQQRQRRPLASLDGTVALCVDALSVRDQ